MPAEDLIDSLVRDLSPRWSLNRTYTLGIVLGILLAGMLFALSLGVRPDLASALGTMRFSFKFVLTVTLASAALGLLFPLSRPGAVLGAWPWLLASVPVLLLAAVVVELAATPEGSWTARLVGTNAHACLLAIPLIATGPLACLMACLRLGAPLRPGLTGAVAGLAASGVAATFYASHCPDDSPLFVATWYVIATGIVTVAGRFAGRSLLEA